MLQGPEVILFNQLSMPSLFKKRLEYDSEILDNG